MKKRIAAGLSLLLCLTGCVDAEKKPQPTETAVTVTETSAAGTTVQTTETEPPPQTPDYVLPALTEPLTLLDGLTLDGTAAAIVCRGATAAVQCAQNGRQLYYIIDLKEKKLLRSGVFTGENEHLTGLTQDGEIASVSVRSDGTGGVLRFYGETESPRSFEAAWIGLTGYDQQTDSFFGFDPADRAVKRISSSGEETVFMQLRPDRSLTGICPDRRILFISEPSADFLRPQNTAAYSMDSGIRLGAIPRSEHTDYAFSGGRLLHRTLLTDPQTGSTSFELRTSRFMDTEILSGVRLEDRDRDEKFDLATDSASPYALGTELTGGRIGALIFADLKAGTRAVQPFPDGEKASAAQFFYSKETARWFCAASFTGNSGTVTRIYAAEPAFAVQTETYLPVETLSPQPEQYQAADYLEGARSLADSIEKQYGIRILIGDEVRNVKSAETESVQTQETVRTDEEIAAETVIALKKLDARLKVYPAGFFKGFRDEYGEGGLAVLTVRAALDGGAASKTGKWYTVALSDPDSLHRLLWQAAERRICDAEPDAFSDDAWNRLLPDGFSYPGNSAALAHDAFANETTQPQEVWFASKDGCRSPAEDRAALIGWFFEGCTAYRQLGTERKLNWELLPQMPHLQAKAGFMAEQTKKVFGSVYWEKVMQSGYDAAAFENENYSPYP